MVNHMLDGKEQFEIWENFHLLTRASSLFGGKIAWESNSYFFFYDLDKSVNLFESQILIYLIKSLYLDDL